MTNWQELAFTSHYQTAVAIHAQLSGGDTELFPKAKRLAEKEMNKQTTLTHLTWAEVFHNDYDLER